MGCDIHMFLERKRTINEQEKWINIDYLKLNPYFKDNDLEKQFNVVEVYGGRNYSLFSMLANVRNGSENQFISEPKGLPKDVCDFVKKESDYWDCDGHSHSWLTLHEIKLFRENNPKTKFSGMVDPKNAALIDAGEMPQSWCGFTNMDNYEYRKWEFETDTLKPLIDAIEERKKEEFWLYGDDERIDLDDDVRIVFWFDN